MRKFTSVIMVATLVLGAANIVHAATDHLTPAPAERPMMPRHGGMHEMFKGLNLTEAQQQQMRTIMKTSHQNIQRPSLEERRAMHSIIASDHFDRDKAEVQATRMSANSKARALAILETQNKLYNVLTPEQKKKFNQRFEQRLTKKLQHKDKMPLADD